MLNNKKSKEHRFVNELSPTNSTIPTTKLHIENVNCHTNIKINHSPIKTTIKNITIKDQTHRRDNSNLNINKDVHKYQYTKPQQTRPECISAENKNEHRTSADDDTNQRDLFLVYYENNLVSASLNALIQHMVPTHNYIPEKDFIFSFLLSARLFIRPHELLARITQIWEQQQKEYSSGNDVVDEAMSSLRQVVTFPVTSASPLGQRKMALIDTIASAAQQSSQSNQRSTIQKSAQHCVCLLSDWIETFPYDFRDERLMQQVRVLARKCVFIDNALGKQVSLILQQLVQRLTALEKYEEFLQSLVVTDLSQNISKGEINLLQHYSTSASAAYTANLQSSSTATFPMNVGTHQKTFHLGTTGITSAPFTCVSSSNSASSQIDVHDVYGLIDFCPSCEQLAHQLTAIELEHLSHIGPEEFVQSFAKEYQNNMEKCSTDKRSGNQYSTSPSLNDIKKTRNLESYVEWFNRLSYLIASEIVKYPKKKQRVRVIEYWIETARECFNIGNFNSLMAIIAGINLEPISRLKKTWSKLQSAKFSVLEHQMDPTSNFNSYRSTLKAAMWRSAGATNERERIIIPFFSLFVKDLYFLNEGCSNRMPNNHINFEKCSQLAKQIMEFNEWKKVTCPFDKLPLVIKYLQTSPIHNENTLSMASFDCEPPDNNEEKGRYKTVKAETKQQLLLKLQEQQSN